MTGPSNRQDANTQCDHVEHCTVFLMIVQELPSILSAEDNIVIKFIPGVQLDALARVICSRLTVLLL